MKSINCQTSGARPLKRLVTKEIEDLLAKKMIEEEIGYSQTVTFDMKDGHIYIK